MSPKLPVNVPQDRWSPGVSDKLLASVLLTVLLFFTSSAQAQLFVFGDLDDDGQITVLDLVRLINHLNGSAALVFQLRGYADVNDDGFLNQADVDVMADAILGLPIPAPLPRSVRSEPSSGASEVGVTVRPKVIFPKPIDTSTLNSNNFYASFAGRKLSARIVPATDGTFA